MPSNHDALALPWFAGLPFQDDPLKELQKSYVLPIV
jgi:hypothetical protein